MKTPEQVKARISDIDSQIQEQECNDQLERLHGEKAAFEEVANGR